MDYYVLETLSINSHNFTVKYYNFLDDSVTYCELMHVQNTGENKIKPKKTETGHELNVNIGTFYH